MGAGNRDKTLTLLLYSVYKSVIRFLSKETVTKFIKNVYISSESTKMSIIFALVGIIGTLGSTFSLVPML